MRDVASLESVGARQQRGNDLEVDLAKLGALGACIRGVPDTGPDIGEGNREIPLEGLVPSVVLEHERFHSQSKSH
jgi:hypothetical protein